jgi:hypothetical protein
MSVIPLFSSFAGLWSTVLQHENAILIDIQVGMIDALLIVFDILEYHGATAVVHQQG